MIRLIVGLVLALGATGVRAEWHRASSAHFVVYADDRPERVRAMAEKLERFDSAVRALRNFPDHPVSPSNRVTVYTLPSPDAVGRLAGSRNTAGFYSPRAAGPVAFVPRQRGSSDLDLSGLAVLLHEYTHHLMLTLFADSALPAWLVEGYAEFHATARFERDGGVVIGAAPGYRAYGLLEGPALPVRDMLLQPSTARGIDQVDAFYGRSWLLTHMLTFDTERAGQLGRYLRQLNDGRSVAESAAAFGDLDQLQRDLNAYLRRRTISALTIGAARIDPGAIEVRALDRGEAAMMAVRIRSTAGVNARTAPDVLADARRAAAPYPDHGFAQRVLAEAEYDVGNYAEAAAAADRAIAADPEMVDALVYRGMAAMALLRDKDDAGPADWAAARQWFIRANRVENDAALPLILYHDSFVGQGIALPDNARAALVQAQALAPQDLGLRMQTADMLLRNGESRLARLMLRPVAYAPHGGRLATHAGDIVRAIDDGGADAAVALIDRARAGGIAEDEGEEGAADD